MDRGDLPQGLREVLANPNHNTKTKIEVIERFTWPVYDLDSGEETPPSITKDQAKQLIKELD